jgi:periplasmic divalent cation tolerance protein
VSARPGPFLIVLTTAGSADEAERIARALVERRLAACVNVVPGVVSIYRWKDAVQRDAEVLLVVKTSEARFEAVRDAILELHSYEVPEVVSIPLHGGSPAYLAWLTNAL